LGKDGRLIARQFQQRMHARSAVLLASLETRFDRIMGGWILLAALACALRFNSTPLLTHPTFSLVAPYLLLIVAPVVSALLALRWFRDGDTMARPTTTPRGWLDWTPLSIGEARRHPLYGTTGLMVSLLVGMLLNVPVRAAEYLASSPPLPALVPGWLSTLHVMMSFDVVLFTSLYAIAFVAGLRRAPLFPALLMTIWALDLIMQLAIATAVGTTPGLPPTVAAALHGLLDGNAKKVLISVAIWLPYLILSTRVNVTFRHRLPA
jgi:hypothetical protein